MSYGIFLNLNEHRKEKLWNNSSSLLDLRLSKKNEGGNVLIAITMQHKTQSQLLNSLYTTPILVRGWAILVNISGGKMGPRGTQLVGTLFFLIFTYLWGIFHRSFRNFGSNAPMHNNFKPETNEGESRLYFELFG